MALIIDQQLVSEDSWQRVDEETLTREGDRLVPLALWQASRDALSAQSGRLGLLIDGSVDLEEIAEELPRFALVAVHFPSFADGRGFSLARLLRERYGFAGQVRAVGEVSRDRLEYMRRCGFDAFEVPDARYAPELVSAFGEISTLYQGAVDEPRPIYRR